MILDTLTKSTARRVAQAKLQTSLEEIKKNAASLPCGTDFPFEKALEKNGLSYICEVKKASPSKGMIAEHFPYLQIAREYEQAGAAAISVLTEPEFFLGNNDYLKEIAQQTSIPVLRKDFTIDEYQLYEAKILGASAVLLICSLLDCQTIKKYIEICDTLGLSALVEAHTSEEVRSALKAGARIIGVNNRNLKTFEVNINNCIALKKEIPDSVLFVAESGIQTSEDIKVLKTANANAVLIGEALMKSSNVKVHLEKLNGGTL